MRRGESARMPVLTVMSGSDRKADPSGTVTGNRGAAVVGPIDLVSVPIKAATLSGRQHKHETRGGAGGAGRRRRCGGVMPSGASGCLACGLTLRLPQSYLRAMLVIRILALLSCGLTLSACAESVLIKSYPAGAKAYVDGQVIGTTPARMTIPRSQVTDPHTWRVEYRNCDPAEGQLVTGIGKGRVVSYIFTLGIAALFKGPNYFHPVDAILTGGDCETRAPAPQAAPGITINQIVGDRNVVPAGEGISNTQKLAERLETLRDLYNRKLITKDVYEAESQKAVGEYTDAPASK